MKQPIIPAILSGGAGTRLWPLSNTAKPKHFHALTDAESLLSRTLRRVTGETDVFSFAPPIILANAAHRTLTREHLNGVEPSALVLEPVGRNTAAAAIIASALAAEIHPDALVLLLPADHIVADNAAFLEAVARAAQYSRTHIVTFGITPSTPATGYGYIKNGVPLGEAVFTIASFHEKPTVGVARKYLDEGGYYWNSGMFLFHPQVMFEEFAARTDILDSALSSLRHARRDGADVFLNAELYASTASQPLDTAVMEKTRRGAVVACDIGWADVGAWDEVYRLAAKDNLGNVANGPVVALDVTNSLLHAEGVKICVAGISDLIVVATREAVIVLPRERAQEVRMLQDIAAKFE